MTEQTYDLYGLLKSLHELSLGSGTTPPDLAEVLKRYSQLSQGLSAEDEFAALCAWSGKCNLIQKLDTSTSSLRGKDYVIPDLLCFIEVEGKNIPILIEVKSSKRNPYPFGLTYMNRLKKFADSLNLPLLIAFKFTGWGRPHWCLFKPESALTSRGSYRVKMPDIFKQDLTGLFLGNFFVQLRKGISIVMEYTKHRVISSTSFEGTLSDIYWETPEGGRIETTAAPLLHWLFSLTEDEGETQEFDNKIIQKFRKSTDESTWALWAIEFALPSMVNKEDNDRINWGLLVKERKFHFTLDHLYQETASCDGLVQTIIHPRPQSVPIFLQ